MRCSLQSCIRTGCLLFVSTIFACAAGAQRCQEVLHQVLDDAAASQVNFDMKHLKPGLGSVAASSMAMCPGQPIKTQLHAATLAYLWKVSCYAQCHTDDAALPAFCAQLPCHHTFAVTVLQLQSMLLAL